MGSGAKLTSSYTSRLFLLAAAMYADDTDLLHWADSQTTDNEELIEHVQSATTDFGQLAQASGGYLKAEICFVYSLAYHTVRGITKLKPLSKIREPKALVEVKTKDGKISLDLGHICVPQPEGDPVYIVTKDVKDPSKMLGVQFVPAGNGVPRMEMMREEGLDWEDKLQSRPLPTRNVWLSSSCSYILG